MIKGANNERIINSNFKIKISNFSKKIVKYYLFQKKIEDFFVNEQNKNKDYNVDQLIQENQLNKIKNFYILDYEWIQNWKSNSRYNVVKYELDQIYDPNNKNIINDLETKCHILEDGGGAIDDRTPLTYSSFSFTLFVSNPALKLKDFECLLDEETFNLFQGGGFFGFFKRKNVVSNIEGIISKDIIILFIEKFQSIKFIYKYISDDKDELIQLTANCIMFNEDHEFMESESKLKYEKLKNFILSHDDNDLIDIFNQNKIEINKEVIITIEDKFDIEIINNNIAKKESELKSRLSKNINFNNINKFRLIGLDNVGATCYMNATLQCFMNINALTMNFLNESIYNKIQTNYSLCELSSAYCNLLEKIWLDDNIKSSYAPNEFKNVISEKNPLFQGVNANDSKDLINFLLEGMNYELSQLNKVGKDNSKINLFIDQTDMLNILKNFIEDFSKNNNSIISNTFFFIIQTDTKCIFCNTLKYNFQALFLLEFPLELIYNYNISQNIPSINNKGRKCVNLYSCFRQYIQPTYFTGENQLYCNTCNCSRDAYSINTFFSLPPVLIIILNRGKGKSFDCDVDFPDYLNLQNYVSYKKSVYNYQLKGVISHLGESGMSGHFIAYCRHRIDNQWYCFNDSIVTLCKDSNRPYTVGTAYILFYESIENKTNIIFDKGIDLNLLFNNNNGVNNNIINIPNNNMNMNMGMNINLINNQNILNVQNNEINNNNNNFIMNGLNNNMNGINNINNLMNNSNNILNMKNNLNEINNNMNNNIDNNMNNNMNNNIKNNLINNMNNNINNNMNNNMIHDVNNNMNMINNCNNINNNKCGININMNDNMNEVNNNMACENIKINNNENNNINNLNNNNLNNQINSINNNINNMNNNDDLYPLNNNMNDINNKFNNINGNMNNFNNNENNNIYPDLDNNNNNNFINNSGN